MQKIIHPCDVPMHNGKKYPLFCEVEIKDGRLSISGVIGPTRGGNAMGGCGQVDMEFDHKDKTENDPRYTDPIKARDLRLSPGWTVDMWYEFLHVWNKWHLNDMHAGCEHQDTLGWTYEEHRGETVVDVSGEPDEEGNYPTTYDKYIGHACPECGYRIGSAWTKRELPANIIHFLASLPDTDRKPNWV